MSASFFQSLTPITQFAELLDPRSFTPAPSDWRVVLTDVEGSTKAIQSGLYKDVNTAGGLAAMAVANVLGTMDFPFVFGGDGFTCLVPPGFDADLADVLADTVRTVKTAFGLTLRASLIPLKDLQDAGHPLRLARFITSQHLAQAVFDGSALDAAERWLKEGDPRFQIEPRRPEGRRADFEGYTCRWKDVPSGQEETLALVLQFRDPENRLAEWKEFMTFLDKQLGGEERYHPIRPELNHLGLGRRVIDSEARVRAAGQGWRGLLQARWWTRWQIVKTWFAMTFLKNHTWGIKDFSRLAEQNRINADYRKFDGSLKMVLSVDRRGAGSLAAYLEDKYRQGRLFYGLHRSDRALLTCLLHQDSAREVHFVDAAGGGYALAALSLKRQKALSAERKSG